jgi:hypothetical protein
MTPVYTLTHRSPVFLKTVYPRHDITLVDDERHIPVGSFISFDGRWRAWRMTRQRVPIPLGACETLASAMYLCRR